MMIKLRLQHYIGDTVYDTLTRKEVKIIGVQFAAGTVWEGDHKTNYMDCGSVGYWIDDQLGPTGGGRHPWEIGPVGRWDLFWYYLPLRWSNFKARFREAVL